MTFEPEAQEIAAKAFTRLQTLPDNTVMFDRTLLDRLISESRDRARSRGALQVTPRDVRDAAMAIAERRRTPVPKSPAEALPQHHSELLDQLQRVREATDAAKLGGSRAPKVLIVGETSGVTSSMFATAGADVATCDIQSREATEAINGIPHFQGDAALIQDLGWDLVLSHPPCTYLSNAGVQYLSKEEGRYDRMLEAVAVFRRLHSVKAPFVCVEQPKMNRYAKQELDGLSPTQYIHPWQHGTGHTKPTALYLSEGLPPIVPTCVVPGRIHALAQLPPGHNRGALRSRTYLGIAGAMALQWMPVLTEYLLLNPDASDCPATAADLVAQANGHLQRTVASVLAAPIIAAGVGSDIASGPTEYIPHDAVETSVLGVSCTIEEEVSNDQSASADHWGQRVVAGVQTKPWTIPRSPPTIKPRPTNQLHLRQGRWRSLEPLAGVHPPSSYVWKPLADADHKSIDEIVSRGRLASQLGKHPNPNPIMQEAASKAYEQERWRKSAADLEHQLAQQLKQIATAAEDARLLDADRVTMTSRERRAMKHRQPRENSSIGHRASKPGVRTADEVLPPVDPPLSTAQTLRLDFESRFLLATPCPVAAISPASAPRNAPAPPSESRDFTDEDIAEIPPPLPFTVHCAYIKDFVVARHSGTRKRPGKLYSVGSATCRIGMSLGDSGAGPSIIGTQLLSSLPADSCVSRSSSTPAVDENLIGADGNPLVTHGTVTVVFTMSGHAFRHEFLVIEGGNLLLLGNDFIARYRATICPFDEDEQGHMDMSVVRRGTRHRVKIPLSCAPRIPVPVAAVATVPYMTQPGPVQPPPEDDCIGTTEVIEGLPAAHPALVPIDDPPSSVVPKAPATSVSPDEHTKSQMVTDEYLLYCKHAITLPARTEVTVWLPVPLAHRETTRELLIDRLAARHGVNSDIAVACSLSVPEDGLVPVRFINIEHRSVTIPAASPVARCLVDYEVKPAGALDLSSDDPYERLSEEQRVIIDSVPLDAQDRLTEAQRLLVRSLLAKHTRAFAINPKDPAHTHLMEVELPLKEDAVPHRHGASRLGEAGQSIVDAHCAEMEANGIIRKSNSAWGSRVVLVKKKSGEIRFCIDFRDLNRKLLTLDSPIPRCDEAIDRLASGAGPQDSLFLCTLDLASGFWTLPIKESHKGRTAFVTHRQKYEWNYLPFGVQSGPSYMCRLMDAALAGLAWDICMPYLDDVGLWSTGVGHDAASREEASFHQMLHRLDLVLERLTWAGLTAKASKCILFATSAPYLGHVISRSGLEMDPAKIEKIRDIDPKGINTLERVRSFVGLCSYYRRFVKGFAAITAPLADLTKIGVDVAEESQRPIVQEAIKTLITYMTSEPVILKMPRYDRIFLVKTDAAQTEGLGGVLGQLDDDGFERVVAYYGRRLTKHERNYTVTEIELLAALESIRTWRPYLWGRKFRLIVDHAALRWLHTMKDTIEGGPASRLMRWNMKLLEYDFEVEHKPGKIHTDADAVSRLVGALMTVKSDRMVQRTPSKRYRDEQRRVHASKVAFYDPETMLAYSWQRTRGGRDLPGGTRDVTDLSDADTLLRECDEEVTLPKTLRDRLLAQVTPTSPRTSTDCFWVRRNETHRVSLWLVPATLAELQAIEQTAMGKEEGYDAGLRPLKDLESCAYGDAVRKGIAVTLAAPVNHLPETVTELLERTRNAFKDWSLQSGISPDVFEQVRAGVVAAIWNGDLTAAWTKDAPVDLTALTVSDSVVVAPAVPSRNQVTTGKSLKRAERVARTTETTRASILESYIRVGTPTDRALRQAQADDPECAALRSYVATGSVGPLVDSATHRHALWARREAKHLRVLDNGLIARIDPVSPSSNPLRPTPAESAIRLYVPLSLRSAYLHAFHDHLGHQGERATFAVMKTRVYWPGQYSDITSHVASCHECTFAKRANRKATHPTRPTVGAYPFDSVVCDICAMTESADGKFDKMIVFADSLSRWVEAIPCKGDPTAEQVFDAYATHVACRYGWPREIRADGGSNLANQLAEEIHRQSGVDLMQGAKYHPESQGIAERVQQTLATMCLAANEGGSHWPDHLPFLMFSYHATPHRVTGLSPAMIVYGHELRLPAQLDESSSAPPVLDLPPALMEYAVRHHHLLVAAWDTAREATAAVQEKTFAEAWSKHGDTVKYAVDDRVCYRTYDKHNKLFSPWFGPHRVTEVMGDGNYRLRDLPNNILDDKFHTSQLRAYLYWSRIHLFDGCVQHG